MVKLSPSILSADFACLGSELAAMQRDGADYAHVDIMDGQFVPNLSMGFPVVKALRKSTSMPLDVHLMIDRPIRYVDRFCEAGADILTIHVEADTEENNLDALRRIKAHGVRPAISVKPKTPAEAVLPYLELVDLILVMTVEPGFGGQSFMTDMMDKTRRLRKLLDEVNPACLIEVDGGIDAVTQGICKKNGVDVMVTGSAYFKAPDRAAFVKVIQG